MLPLLRALHRFLGHLLDRLTPEIERETVPPPVPVWCSSELAACPDLLAVDRVLARWQAEGLSPDLLVFAREEEVRRRLTEGVRVNSWGGSA